MRILVFQHADVEQPANFRDFLAEEGIASLPTIQQTGTSSGERRARLYNRYSNLALTCFLESEGQREGLAGLKRLL